MIAGLTERLEKLIEWIDDEEREPAKKVFSKGHEYEIASRFEILDQELAESARLHGIGGSREAVLLTKLEAITRIKEG